MSSRSAERSKAVRLAWEREQQLVREGRCTRDWTKEQQLDILDPAIGKAYDDKGRSFEGQHMKSVQQYPEYADNPDNIQFLTKDEHLEAHKGNWQNPTNWYYDPKTKVFIDFGEREIIPCKVFSLSDPITAIQMDNPGTKAAYKRPRSSELVKEKDNSADPKNNKITSNNKRGQAKTAKEIKPRIKPKAAKTPKGENWFIKGLKSVGSFIVKHPAESMGTAGLAIKIISSFTGNGNRNNNAYDIKSGRSSYSGSSGISTKVADIAEKTTRAMPHENDVPGHRQRYHTRDGIIWKDKGPYHRG